jgi:EpsI family protein
MNATRWRAALLFVLMVVAFAGAQAWRPTAHLADTRPRIQLEQLFPVQVGDWRVDDRLPVQLVSPDTQAMLNAIYNQTLSRTYVNPRGERIMLSVAYGGDQSDATRAHRPEVCYPAQGFQIMSGANGLVALEGGPLTVRQLVARQGSRNEPITYWITVGERTTITGTQQKLAQLSYSSRGVIPDGMLVRVSSIDTDAAAAFALQARFVQALAGGLPPDQRALVVGRPGA